MISGAGFGGKIVEMRCVTVNYDLSEKEAELIESYRKLYPSFQENVYATITSLYDLQACATRILSEPDNLREPPENKKLL